jgi:hypothetical protein
MTKAKFPAECKGGDPFAEFAADTAENDAYYAAMLHEGWALAETRPHTRSRKRKPSIATMIRHARKAGERGEVRVELVNIDGTRTIVTSSRDAAINAMSEEDAEKLWHERIGNAAH